MKTTRYFIVSFFVFMFGIVFSGNTFAQAEGNKAEVTFKTNMVCGACKMKIEKNMAFERGVQDLVVNLEANTVTITYKTNRTTPEKLAQALIDLGYKAETVAPCCRESQNESGHNCNTPCGGQ